jgi:hypothetical protein
MMKNNPVIKYKPKPFESNDSPLNQPLGMILQKADLLSAAQIELALRDQSIYQDLRIGEILVLRGWIKTQTVDFFVEQLPILAKQKQQKPLGYYLQKAALLDEDQIKQLLSRQNQGGTWVRLGKLLVMEGLLKPNTVDFFLEHLSRKSQLDTVFIGKNTKIRV